MQLSDYENKRVNELIEGVRECIGIRIEKEKALGIRRRRITTYGDYQILRRALTREIQRQQGEAEKLDAELRNWQESLPVATVENVEAIRKMVRKDREEAGLYAAIKGIDYITSNAGTRKERLFTESQIKEIFREIVGEES